MNFLRYDSPFMSKCRCIVDYMLLGWLWVIASLPIITFGVSTTAMLRTAEKSIRQNEGAIFVPFWKYFRQEFKQATVLWIIQIPILEFILVDIIVVRYLNVNVGVQVVIFVMCILVFCWLQLWFGYQSKIKDNIRTVLLNTFRMTVSDVGRTFLMSLLTIAAVVVGYFSIFLFSPLVLLIPGIYITAYTALLRKVFSRYMSPENDKLEVLAE